MPNLDGGHYFLTVLAPIRVDIMIDPDEIGRSRSHRQLLAQKLALLATGKQTAESPPNAKPSPFSFNSLNHLARFVIIHGPVGQAFTPLVVTPDRHVRERDVGFLVRVQVVGRIQHREDVREAVADQPDQLLLAAHLPVVAREAAGALRRGR